MSFRLNVGTFNFHNGGWHDNHTSLNLEPLFETISQFVPHVLFLQETRRWGDNGSAILYQVANGLSEFFPDGDRFVPYLCRRDPAPDQPVVLVSGQHVIVDRWFDPYEKRMSEWHYNFLQTRIAGHQVWLTSIHWHGGFGNAAFERQAAVLSQLADRATLVGGDFNCQASGPREPMLDWQATAASERHKLIQKLNYRQEDRAWVMRTWPLDMLIGPWNPQIEKREDWAGFYDVGEQGELDSGGRPVQVLTPTVNSGVDAGGAMRIDRLLASKLFPGRLVPGSYRVHQPSGTPASDHRYVTASFDFDE